MLIEVVAAANAIDALAAAVTTTGSDAPYFQQWAGWNAPPLSSRDVVARLQRISAQLKALSDADVDEALREQLGRTPTSLAWFQANTIPQLPGPNGPMVLSNLDFLLSSIESGIPNSSLNWEHISKSELVPRDLSRRIRSLQASIDRLEPRVGDISSKVDIINDAHSAASDLPTDLQSLKEARDEIERYTKESSKWLIQTKDFSSESEDIVLLLRDDEKSAKQLLANMEATYTAATSIGLASGFSERARQLSRSTWIWVLFLFLALCAGGYLGNLRLQALQALVSTRGINGQWIWLEASMSVLSLAAPIWFAWLATRQIGQRFRLAEDYGFKASVAKAYEGFRKEAARLDPELENRLFSSALDRLDEAPLRFLSLEEHSSPYEALISSPGFQKILDKIPDTKNEIIEIIKNISGNKGEKISSAEDDDGGELNTAKSPEQK